MTDDAVAEDVHGCVVSIASRLQQQVNQISLAMCTALVAEMPELCGEDRPFEMLDAGVAANLDTIFQALLHDVPVGETTVPALAVDYARRLARHGVPVNTLVRAYRLGQRHMTELVFTELQSLQIEPTTRVAAIEAITTFVFEYVEWVSEHLVGAYESEHVQWREHQNSIRAMRVRDLLGDDTTIAVDTASAAIDYPLHQQHLALILWHTTDDELTQLQLFTDDLAAAVGTSARPLFAAVDRAGAWVWLPFESASGDLTGQIRDYTNARPELLNIAMGALGSGVQGFRRSHRQAQRARAAALADARRLSARPVNHVVLTHKHFDHVLGSSVFTGAEIYCAPEVVDYLASATDQLRADALAYGADAKAVDEAIAALRVPPHGISQQVLDLGGRSVTITHLGAGHTRSDLVVVVPGTRPGEPTVVFTGDLVEESADPAVDADSDLAAWPDTLDRLLAIGGTGRQVRARPRAGGRCRVRPQSTRLVADERLERAGQRAGAVHAAIRAPGSVTLSTSTFRVIDFHQTLAGTGGSIVSCTKPLREPLTSQRDPMTCTPAVKTRSLLASAVLIDDKGMSAVNAHPILT